MGRVIALRRRASDSLVPILAIALGVLLAACGSSASPSPARTASPAPSITAVPGVPASPAVGASVAPPKTTDTAFGKIFDALPPSFPNLPGQKPADMGAGPTSGAFALTMDAAAASAAIKAGLQAQGWTADIGSPLEDGTVVLVGTGPTPGCKTEVRFTPTSGTVIMSVLYGASCPFA